MFLHKVVEEVLNWNLNFIPIQIRPQTIYCGCYDEVNNIEEVMPIERWTLAHWSPLPGAHARCKNMTRGFLQINIQQVVRECKTGESWETHNGVHLSKPNEKWTSTIKPATQAPNHPRGSGNKSNKRNIMRSLGRYVQQPINAYQMDSQISKVSRGVGVLLQWYQNGALKS